MCLAVYLASAHPLPLVPWDSARPAFHVTEAGKTPVRARFGLPRVYRLDSHEGCGCGFEYGQWPVESDEDRLREVQGRASVASLRAYVTAVAQRAPVELYACWEGEQELAAKDVADVEPAQLGGAEFRFVQRRLLHLGRSR